MNIESKNHKLPKRRYIEMAAVVLVVLSLILASCAPAAPATPDQSAINTMVAATLAAQPAPTQPPAPTAPPAPTVPPPPPQATVNPSIPVAVVPTPVPGGPSLIANFNTFIRGGPGTNYVVYSSLLGGKTATPVGRSQDGLWWVVSVPPAPLGQGWVIASMVNVTNVGNLPVVPAPPVPPTTNMVPPGPTDPQATALAEVFVRNGPGPQYPAYGIAPASQTGRVLGKSEDGQWWTVRINPANVGAGYGWVAAAYVQASNVSNVPVIKAPAASAPQPLPPPTSGSPTVTAVEFVNVRSGPGTNYPSYGTAAPGAVGQVTGKSQDGGWWQVKVPTTFALGGLAWVSASFVIPQNTGSVPVVAAPPPPPPPPASPPPAPAAACQLVSQTPPDNSAVAANTAYTFTWVLKNTGTVKWDQSEYDVIFVSSTTGYSMHSGGDVYDLPSTVEPGQTVTISGSGITPATAGPYTESWGIAQGSNVICPFYVTIQVK